MTFRAVIRRRRIACRPSQVALGVVALTGCFGGGSPATDVAATRALVESTTTSFHQSLRTNDSSAFLRYLSDDVLMVPPGEAPVRGIPAMRAWLTAFLSQYQTSALNLTDREVFVGDEWATEMGRYEWGLQPVAGGPAIVDQGHYMQVWKRGPDGKWRFAREIWNSSAPPSP